MKQYFGKKVKRIKAMTEFDLIEQHVKKTEMGVASRLTQLRMIKKITAAQLSEIIDIEPEELFDYENGSKPVPASILVLLSVAFKVNLDYFYSQDAYPHVPTAFVTVNEAVTAS